MESKDIDQTREDTLPGGFTERQQKHSLMSLIQRNFSAVLSCVLYATMSVMTTLTNKGVSSFNFKFTYAVLYWQTLVTVVGLLLLRRMKVISFSMPPMSEVKRWVPLNVIFCIMLYSNTRALWYISVPMITVIKSFSTVFIGLGDALIFGQPTSKGVYASMVIMVISSITAGFNDLSFNLYGYICAGINCLAAVAYALYMRFALKSSGVKEFAAVFLNNALGLITFLPFLLFSGELVSTWNYVQNELSSGFVALILINGFCGAGISVASWHCVSATSPTTYSMVGALNKIPLMFIGWAIFGAPMTNLGVASVCIGLGGSILYTYCKATQNKKN